MDVKQNCMRWYSIYRQEYRFKVSYGVLTPKQSLPKGAVVVKESQAPSKTAAANTLKGALEGPLKLCFLECEECHAKIPITRKTINTIKCPHCHVTYYRVNKVPKQEEVTYGRVS